jgi:superkiller protein 3
MKIMRNDEAMLAFQKALQHNKKDPVAWNGLGNVYYSIGYIDDSISAYGKAIEFAPTLAQPWNGLGDAYVSVGRDLDAIAAYQRAIEINKQFIPPWLRLADIYSRQGRNKDAIKTFRRALNMEPNNPSIWNDLGLTLIKINAFEEAIRAFNEAIKLNRSFGWAYCNLALCYANQKKYTEAIELCRKSLFVFKEDIDKAIACDRMASYYRAINDYENAVEAYQLADRLKGQGISTSQNTNPETHIPFSQPQTEHPAEISSFTPPQESIVFDNSNETIKVQQDRQAEPDLAFQSVSWNQNTSTISTISEDHTSNKKPIEFPFEEAMLEQTTEELPMSNELSFFSHPIGNRNTSSELFENSFNIGEMTETKNPTVWNEKGNIHFQNHAYNEAIIAYNKAIELDRSFGWPYSNLALTYLTLGKYAEAILLYQKSICLLKTNEEKAFSWNNLGNIYRHQNNYEKALNAYQNADEIDPQNAGRHDKADLAYTESNSENAQVWLELGNLFFKTSSYSEAVYAYTKAVKIDPTSGLAHSNLAMSLVIQGKYKEAASIYLKSITLFNNNKEKAISWNRLGNVYRKMNDYENAKKAYQNAIKLSNEKTSVLTRTRFSLLGNCYSN